MYYISETCPGPGGDSGPGCLQFRPPCPWDHGLIPCHEPHENEPHTGSSQEPVCKQYINLFTVSAKAEIANLMAIPKSSIHFTWLSFFLFLIFFFFFYVVVHTTTIALFLVVNSFHGCLCVLA